MSGDASPSKAMESGEKDTVVEKLLNIFPAMDREVARSVLISCDYDLAQTVATLKELGIHKAKESALKEEKLAQPTLKESPRRSSGSGTIAIPKSPVRGSGTIAIPTSPVRGSGSDSSHSGSSGGRSGSQTRVHAPYGRSPSTYVFGSSPTSNAYFTDYEDTSITNLPRQSPVVSSGRRSVDSPNPYLPSTNPYAIPPGYHSGPGSSAVAMSPSTRPAFYAYSFSSSPGSIYPIHTQGPSTSPATAASNRPSAFSSTSNPYTFSSSPNIGYPQFAAPNAGMPSSSQAFYQYSYASSPGSAYPISAQPGANPFLPTGGADKSSAGSPGMPHFLSSSPGAQYFGPGSARFGSPAASRSDAFRKVALHSSLKERLLSKAIKIEDESEDESDDEKANEDSDEEAESVGDNDVMFACEEDFDNIRNSTSARGSPSQDRKQKPTIIILRQKQHDKTAISHHSDPCKRQMPSLALRLFMKLVFKNRTDISPMNPIAALFMCLSQIPELQTYCITDAYKADLKPVKNKAPVDLGISGDWDAQDVYHGSRCLSLAQHLALCIKTLQGKIHHDLRELDEQFSAFQQLVSSRASHLSGTGNVEEEAGRYSDIVDWLLEHLKEDFNVKSPAFEPTPDDEALGDDHVAAKYWESYKKTNPCLLANLFTALLKTAVTCSGCNHRMVSVSITNGLMLPTSLDKKRSFDVTFVPEAISSSNKPIKYTVSVFKTGYGQDIKADLITQLGKPLDPGQIILAEVYGGRIAQIIDDTTPVQVLKDKDVILAYEIPPSQAALVQRSRRMSFPFDKNAAQQNSARSDMPYFVINRLCKRNDDEADIIGKPFPVPRNLTYAQVYNLVWERFKESLGYTKELTYSELAEQIRESEEKRIAGETGDKGREDVKEGRKDHVGPFAVKVMDQFLANCGSCDKGFRCDGCVMPSANVPGEVAPEQHIVIDWNLTKEEYDGKLHKSLVFNLTPDKVEQSDKPKQQITIQDCLHKFLGQYKVPEWFCQGCKEFKQASKVTAIVELPPVLMFHLSRFEHDRYWHRISKTEVDFPISGLDLSCYVEPNNCAGQQQAPQQKTIYDLQAVLQLSGDQGYSACIRHFGDNRFYHYTPNGTYLLPSEESDLAGLKSIICSGDACLLFYIKRKETSQ